MSRPTMAGRKLHLTVEESGSLTALEGSLPAASSPKGKGTTSPLSMGTLSPQNKPSTPLGAIPQESRRRAPSAVARVDGDEEKQQEQEEEKRQEEDGEDEVKAAGEDHHYSLEVAPAVALDFEDRASSGMLNASMQQRIGKAFFQSLALTRDAELAAHPVEEPLHKAIVSEELVDVAILLDELGPEGPSKIAARDRCGRTALHLAAMGNSAVIIETLLTCFRRTTLLELLHDLARLEADKNRILADVKTALLMKQGVVVPSSKSLSLSLSSFSSSSKDAKYLEASVEKSPRILAVNEWFFNESVRKQRQAEVRVEVWWARLLATRDGFGRTALHYATARTAPVEVLSALCSSGRAELLATARGVAARAGVGAIKTPLFDKLSVYDSASGLEIASLSGNYPGLATTAVAFPSAAAQSKSDGGEDLASINLNLNASLGVHNIAYELGSTLGLAVDVPMPDKAAAESFEVVVPWVMRNVLKRATDTLCAEGLSGIAALERHFAITVSKPSATILVPEMRRTLALLGIRVTNDVLREMCRRYPADRDEVEDKWHKVSEEQAAQKKSIQQELIYLRRRAAARERRGDGSKGGSFSSDSNSNAEEKGMPSSSTSSAKSGGGDDDYDDHADSKRGKGDDEDEDVEEKEGERSKGKGKGGVRFVPKEPKALTERRDRLLLMDETDKDKGVDFLLLLADIKNGRGLQSLDLKTMSVSGSDKKSLLSKGIEAVSGKDEAKLADLEELLLDTHVDQMGAPRISSSSSSSSSHSRATSLVYPACVTVESMGKSRKAVINTPDFFGRSPLMIASALGLKDVVEVLVKFGGDVSLCTGEGHSALSLARGASTRNVLEKALVQWLSQKDAGMVGSSERRLVEIKKTSSASFLDSLRGSSSSAAPGKQGDKGASAESQSSLAQRANVVSGLAAQLQQLSCKNWAYGRPPLSWAVNNGLVSVVKQSLNAGSDVNRSDALCRTPLHECASLISSTSHECHFEAAVEIAEVLLQAGADCNAASVSGRRPLHDLFCRGQDAAVSFAKISLKSSSKKATPATAPCTKALFHVISGTTSHSTLQDYRRQLTKTLLGFGADPVLHDRQGMGAVHYCARENDAGCMLEILRRHCDVSTALTSRNQSALHVACKAGAKDVATLLARWDADSRPSCGLLSQLDAQGKTPTQLLPPSVSARELETLWACARQGQVNKVRDLLNAMKMSGAPLWEGSAAVEDSEGAGGKGGGVAGAQELWLLDGIDAKSRKMRWTALHACLAGWAEREARSSSNSATGKPNLCARRALGLETAPSSPTRAAAAAAAAGGGNLFPETLQLLLNNSAFCDAMDVHCRTPLMLAAAANLVVAIDLLVAAGADVSARDLDGRTALHIANSFGAASAVSSLEALGADPELRDLVGGKRPFELVGKPLSVPVFY